ncbi:MAG: hypothetical protein SGILL_006290 [Bacillariaceae sp.]
MPHSAFRISLFILSTLVAIATLCDAFSVRIDKRKIRPISAAATVPLAMAKGFGSTSTSSNSKKGKKEKKTKYPKRNGGSYNPDTSDTTKRLLEWLDKEEVEGLEGAEIGLAATPDGTMLRGVFAKQDFSRGDYILAVPFVSTLLIKEDFEVTETKSDDAKHCLLASQPENGMLLWQRFLHNKDMNSDSQHEKYKAYLDCLPMSPEDPHFDETPDFWSDEEIQRLKVPSLVEQIQSRKKAIENVAIEYNENHPGNPLKLSELQQACWMLQTRGFTTFKKAIDLDGREGVLSRVILIPFVDFVNHGPDNKNDPECASNAVIEVIETKEYDESFYALVAARTIRKGEEIRICYGTGKETTPELFAKYGFFPAGNEQNDKSSLSTLLEGASLDDSLEELGKDEGRRLDQVLALQTMMKHCFY